MPCYDDRNNYSYDPSFPGVRSLSDLNPDSGRGIRIPQKNKTSKKTKKQTKLNKEEVLKRNDLLMNSICEISKVLTKKQMEKLSKKTQKLIKDHQKFDEKEGR